MTEQNDYESAYSEQGFWDKLKGFATTAGREVVEKTLLLYYAAQRHDVPRWAKTTVAASLGYFIFPLDGIPDFTPAVGFADDLGVLTLAVATVAMYIDDDVREKTAARLRDWFGD